MRSFAVIAPHLPHCACRVLRFPNVVRPLRLLLPSGLKQLQPFGIVVQPRASTLRCRTAPNIFKLHLSFHKPLGPPCPCLRKLCSTSVSDTSTKARGAGARCVEAPSMEPPPPPSSLLERRRCFEGGMCRLNITMSFENHLEERRGRRIPPLFGGSFA